jgi:hypothetical protein
MLSPKVSDTQDFAGLLLLVITIGKPGPILEAEVLASLSCQIDVYSPRPT